MDSILNSIKKMLGIEADYTAFDTDIIIHINTVFSILHQVGGSNVAGFAITGPEAKWSDFLGDLKDVEMVKTYIYLRVRLIFDPPSTSFTIDAFKKQADELEWRLNALELVFNPHAYDHLYYGLEPTEGYYWWEIEETEGFPIPARVGDVGFDEDTGNVWRKY